VTVQLLENKPDAMRVLIIASGDGLAQDESSVEDITKVKSQDQGYRSRLPPTKIIGQYELRAVYASDESGCGNFFMQIYPPGLNTPFLKSSIPTKPEPANYDGTPVELPFEAGVSNEIIRDGVSCHIVALKNSATGTPTGTALEVMSSCNGGPPRYQLLKDSQTEKIILENGVTVRYLLEPKNGVNFYYLVNFRGTIQIGQDVSCEQTSECPFFTYCDKDGHICIKKDSCEAQEENPDLTKINLVFISDDFGSKDEFADAVNRLTGSSWIDFSKNTETPLFSFEPLKSNRDKFNVLLLYRNQRFNLIDKETQIGTIRGLSADGEYFMSDMQEYCVTKGIPIVLSRQGFISTGGRTLKLSLEVASAGLNGAFEISKMCVGKELCSGRILTHELGHTLGGLKDEYVVDGGVDLPGYPNCAPDKDTAKHWWGDLEGEGTFGLNIGYYGGCSYTSDNIRPTKSSIMGSGQYEGFFPGFGAVNERQLERAIQYWNAVDKPEKE